MGVISVVFSPQSDAGALSYPDILAASWANPWAKVSSVAGFPATSPAAVARPIFAGSYVSSDGTVVGVMYDRALHFRNAGGFDFRTVAEVADTSSGDAFTVEVGGTALMYVERCEGRGREEGGSCWCLA